VLGVDHAHPRRAGQVREDGDVAGAGRAELEEERAHRDALEEREQRVVVAGERRRLVPRPVAAAHVEREPRARQARGDQPPPSWGAILNEGKEFLALAPWVSLFPGGVIMVAVLSFNVIGDGLRDAFDPRAEMR
jgi:hypothetical protein